MSNLGELSVEVHRATFETFIDNLNALGDRYDMTVSLLVESTQNEDYLKTPAGKAALAERFEEIKELSGKIMAEIEAEIARANYVHGEIIALPQYDRLFYGTVMTDSKFIEQCDEFKELLDGYAEGFAASKAAVEGILAVVPSYLEGHKAPTSLKTPEFPGRY